jgi:TonB-dependent receptor
MKNRFKSLLLAATAGALLLSHGSFAAEVKGRVTADASGTSIVGAEVEIVELRRKTRTGADGSYRFTDLPPGKYTLRITYAGGKSTEIQVEATSAGSVTGDVSIEGEDAAEKVVVVGQRGQLASAVARQRAADGVQSVATRDSIGQFPDQNAAEAVRRLPGVNVLNDQGEGRFVSVRGLDPNLNSSSINGVRSPAPESDIRAVALDVVPSELLESIEVKKTLTPDMDADTIGASIEINTTSSLARKKPYFGAKLEGSYNEYTNQWSPKVGVDFSTKLTETLGVAGGLSFSRRNFATDNIEAEGWNEDGGIVYAEEIEYRDYDVIRERLGVSLSFDWRASDTTTLFARGLFSRFDDQEYRRRLVFDMEDAVPVSGSDTTATFDSAAGERFTVIRDLKDRFERQEVTSFVVGGKTLLDLWRFDYSASYATASEEEDGSLDPARFRQRFSGSGSSGGTVTFDFSQLHNPTHVFGIGAANFLDPTRYSFYRLEDTDLSLSEDKEWSFKGDITRTFAMEDGTFDLKFGAKARLREKTYDLEIDYFTGYAGGLNMSGFAGPATYGIADIGPVPGKYGFRDFYGTNIGNFSLSTLDTQFESSIADYAVEEDIWAGYVMGRYESGPLTAIGGVRVEQTKNKLNGNLVELVEAGQTYGGVVLADDTVFVTPTTLDNQYTDWLPSGVLRYEASDDVVVRFGAFRSVVRPKIGQIAPRFIVEDTPGDGRVGEFGNPELKPYKAWNFDLSGEWYFAREAVLSGGVFFKKVSDFIVDAEFTSGVFNGVAYDEATIPINGDDATIKGFEFNYQQSLIFLPDPFDGLLAAFNYTYTDAEGDVLGRTIPLPAASKHTYTGLLGYEKGPISLRVAATYRDEYLDELSGSPEEDRYVKDHLQWDFTAKYALTDNLKLVGELVNVNDATYLAFQNGPGGDRLLQYEEYGWTGKIGIRYSN